MSKPEIRAYLHVVDGVLQLRMDSTDRDTRTFKVLTKDGEWREVGLYERGGEDTVFLIPPEKTKELVEQLTKAPA